MVVALEKINPAGYRNIKSCCRHAESKNQSKIKRTEKTVAEMKSDKQH